MQIIGWKDIVAGQEADLRDAHSHLEANAPARATALLQMAAEECGGRQALTPEDRALRDRHLELAASARAARDWSFRGDVDHALLAVEDALGEPAAGERHAARRAAARKAREGTAHLEAAARTEGTPAEVAMRILAAVGSEHTRPAPPVATAVPTPAATPTQAPTPPVPTPPPPAPAKVRVVGKRYAENPQAPGRALVRGEGVQAPAAEKARVWPAFRSDADYSSRRPLRTGPSPLRTGPSRRASGLPPSGVSPARAAEIPDMLTAAAGAVTEPLARDPALEAPTIIGGGLRAT